MQKKDLLLLLHAIILFSMLAVHEAKAPSAIVGMSPLPCTAGVGTTFDINVTVMNVVNLYAWEFNMTFDTTFLDAVAVNEGPFLLDTGYGTWWLDPTLDNTRGIVTAGCSLFPYPEYGADGNGVLATITFQVKLYGTSTLHFADTKLRTWDPGAGELVAISHTATDGWVDSRITGDATSDKTVNVLDILAVKSRWGRTPASPDWIREYDVNYDDAINVLDILTVKANWGQTAP